MALGLHGQRTDVADVETDVVGVDATFYFPPIDDARGPYSLAPFLSRSSRVTVEAHRAVSTTTFGVLSPITGVSSMEYDADTEGGSIFGRYVLRSSGWFAGGGYRVDGGEPARGYTDLDGYSLHVGKYVSASTSLELGWDSTDTTAELGFYGCLFPYCASRGATLISKNRAEEASVRVFHVGDIGRLLYSVSGKAASRRIDRSERNTRPTPTIEYRFNAGHLLVKNPPPFRLSPGLGFAVAGVSPFPETPSSRVSTYSAAFDAFPTARLGVGVGYSRWRGDTLDDDAYDVSVDWFFLRNVAVGVRLARTNREVPIDALDHLDEAGIRLTGRF